MQKGDIILIAVGCVAPGETRTHTQAIRLLTEIALRQVLCLAYFWQVMAGARPTQPNLTDRTN